MAYCTPSVDLVVHAHGCGFRSADRPTLLRSSFERSYIVTANLLPGRRVPSDGRYPRAATTASVLSHGNEFAVPSDTVLLEISVQMAHVDVSPASCTRYNQRPILPTAGWLHPLKQTPKLKRLVSTAPVLITSASLKLRQERLNRCDAVVTFQLRCTQFRLSSSDEDC